MHLPSLFKYEEWEEQHESSLGQSSAFLHCPAAPLLSEPHTLLYLYLHQGFLAEHLTCFHQLSTLNFPYCFFFVSYCFDNFL